MESRNRGTEAYGIASRAFSRHCVPLTSLSYQAWVLSSFLDKTTSFVLYSSSILSVQFSRMKYGLPSIEDSPDRLDPFDRYNRFAPDHSVDSACGHTHIPLIPLRLPPPGTGKMSPSQTSIQGITEIDRHKLQLIAERSLLAWQEHNQSR